MHIQKSMRDVEARDGKECRENVTDTLGRFVTSCARRGRGDRPEVGAGQHQGPRACGEAEGGSLSSLSPRVREV